MASFTTNGSELVVGIPGGVDVILFLFYYLLSILPYINSYAKSKYQI